MKLLILLLSLIFISCSNNTEKVYTKTTISAGTIEDGKFKEQYKQENIEEGDIYYYINN